MVHEATADAIACSFARGNDARARFVYVVEPVAAKKFAIEAKGGTRGIATRPTESKTFGEGYPLHERTPHTLRRITHGEKILTERVERR